MFGFFVLFYKASITLTWKPDETATRKLQANIPKEHKCKNPQQKILETKFNNAVRGSFIIIKLDLSQGHKDGSMSVNQYDSPD